jgi:uncharacterized protein YdeI (YjbR/CyaY-like superfamily)
MSPKPTFFETPAELRRWYEKHHDTAPELWIGYHKKESGRGGVIYREALDQALCFGWIDGIVKRIDADCYMQRYTPRRAKSIWSNINIRKVEALREAGQMKPSGLAAFAARDPKRSGVYSFENRPKKLTPALEKTFRANKKAWTFFAAQPPGYQRLVVWRVMSAKQDATRERRLADLIRMCIAGRRYEPMKPAKK